MGASTVKARLRPAATTAAAVVAVAVVSELVSAVRVRRAAVSGGAR